MELLRIPEAGIRIIAVFFIFIFPILIGFWGQNKAYKHSHKGVILPWLPTILAFLIIVYGFLRNIGIIAYPNDIPDGFIWGDATFYGGIACLIGVFLFIGAFSRMVKYIFTNQ